MTLHQITCTKHPEPLQDKVWFSSRVITDVTFTWLGLMRKEHGIPGSLLFKVGETLPRCASLYMPTTSFTCHC